MENKSGIYCIQSKILPHRIYIGSSKNLKKRISGHLYEIHTYSHKNKKINNHIKKYGRDDLDIFVVKNCGIEDLLPEEQFLIDILDPYFNISKLTTFPLFEYYEKTKKDPNYKKEVSKETREKLSKILKGKKRSVDFCNHMALVWEERRKTPVSEETRMKHSRAMKGRKHTEESRIKMSESQKGRKWSEKQNESFLKSEYRRGASKFIGVGFSNHINKFYAAVHYGGKKKHIGVYANEVEAAIAYNEYVIINDIKNKRLNIIPEGYEQG